MAFVRSFAGYEMAQNVPQND